MRKEEEGSKDPDHVNYLRKNEQHQLKDSSDFIEEISIIRKQNGQEGIIL